MTAFILAVALLGNPPPSLLDRALIEYHEANYESSLTLLKQAAKASPPDSRISLLKGMVLRRLSREGDAASALKEALKLDPKNFDAGLNLGLACYASGHWSCAQDAFENSVRDWPSRPEPLLGLGSLHQARKRWVEARAAFERALKLEKKLIPAWLGLADCLIELGLLREAAEARDHALALSKTRDPELSFKQAGLWYALGEFKKSQKALLESEAGATAEAFYLQGCLNFRAGELEKAERQFEAALEARPDYPEAELNLGIVLYNQGRENLALQRFESLLRRHPRHKAARDYQVAARGMAYDRLMRQGSQAVIANDPISALTAWERALPLAPDASQVRRMIQSLRAAAGPLAAPLPDTSAEGLAKKTAEKKEKIAAREQSAEALIRQGNDKDAMGEFEAALFLDPENPRLMAKLRQTRSRLRRALSGLLARSAELEAAKKTKEALDAAEAALALDPEDLEAGRMARRLAAALKVNREDPTAANSLYYEGAYRYGAGDTKKALALWRQGLKAAPKHTQIRQAIQAAETKLKSLAELERRQ